MIRVGIGALMILTVLYISAAASAADIFKDQYWEAEEEEWAILTEEELSPPSVTVYLHDYSTDGWSSRLMGGDWIDILKAIAKQGPRPSRDKNFDDWEAWNKSLEKELGIERFKDVRDISKLYYGFLEVRMLRLYEAGGYRIVSIVGELNGDKIVYMVRSEYEAGGLDFLGSNSA